jgi:two-component system CheB/CheR fusion protein
MTFPLVAIGASAGGLEALSELLAALPPQSELACVIVQHLDPQHTSLLPELLAKKTALPVVPIQEGVAVEPRHVYVIPPNATVTMSGERLHLSRRGSDGPHHPVDVFFRSLAEARGESAIGVVLSGGDADGALGTQAIKHGGGITFAQEPTSARFPSMPQSAIETDCVDYVLRPSEIALELARLSGHPYLRAAPPPHSEPREEVSGTEEEETLRRILRRLRSAHGVDFSQYKRSTVTRRLARRMALRKVEQLPDYLTVLENDPEEVAALQQDFLIHVTGFFRDPESFDGLRMRIFPRLTEGRSPKETLRIWIPGCASGEEVYSIAIALTEYLGDRVSSAGIQFFGTDVSEAQIERARAGIYPEGIERELSTERLSRFFVKEDSHYHIAKSLRDLCIFARQDLLRDPPFSRLDLVSCRNVLIYLDVPAQRRVMQLFHYALRPQGFLQLGPSESVGAGSELFELIDKHHRIYVRKPAAPTGLDLGSRVPRRREVAEHEPASPEATAESVQHEADRLLLGEYAPASLLIDDALNILQVRGDTAPYLQLASGAPSLNLQRIARPELLVEIVPAISEARASGARVRREGLRVDELEQVTLEVMPVKAVSPVRCYLIVLEDAARSRSRRAVTSSVSHLPESEKDRRLVQLERELAAMRDYLQSTMEQQEAAQEELKSANEEVLSANEEFQSTNEELETAKEELQSVNEELTTTNDELRSRNRELSGLNDELKRTRGISDRARSYADAIVASVREPLLVLGLDLKVLRANPAFYRDFAIRPEQLEGRLLRELAEEQWNVPQLLEVLEGVLSRNAPLDDYEVRYVSPERAPQTLSVSARKIQGDGERTELILLAIENVTKLRVQAEQLANEVHRKDEFLAMLAHELRNPLSPITHAIHLLRGDGANVPPSKLYDLIERQTQRLVRLVDELLDVARISRGHIELKRERVDLIDIVQHAAEASRPRMEERRHTLTLALPEDAVCVEGDPIRLEQIVANLLENASKYTEPGGRIEVSLAEVQGQARLSVRDNGIGLAPDTLESIFGLFAQVDRSLAHSGGGLGIGLTLVRRVLSMHGGTVEARSGGLGQGTEFLIRLPIAPARAPPPRQRPSHPSSSAHPLATSSHRVLIVDDNADAAQSLALLARAWGHEVAVASDGPSALALAQRFEPQRALVDIGLPGMSGYELARRLRTQHPQLYLVAMTGYGRETDRREAHSAGFDVHLVKPANPHELQVLLANGGGQPTV